MSVEGRPATGSVQAACELLAALSSPHRLAIVLELAAGSRCVHELVDSLGVSQSLASQHLRVLRTSGLVVGVRRGKEIAYSLADDHVASIAHDALAHSSEPWPSGPDHADGQAHEGLPHDTITKTKKGAPS